MNFLQEYRDKDKIHAIAGKIKSLDSRPMKIMEVCGTQTHTIMKYGLEELLPEKISLIHGPGCPVCVTPEEIIDKAILLGLMENSIIAAYGDMMRVPGSGKSLLNIKAEGADIRIIYSPLDAVFLAQQNPSKNVTLFAIGFETTSPANASALLHAFQLKLKNFFMLSAQVLIAPAVELILNSENVNIDALLAPGHVCTVTGLSWCHRTSSRFKIPISVTGFEPLDILEGIYFAAHEVINGSSNVNNQYCRIVNDEGNPEAQRYIEKIFKITGRNWRGIGYINDSGLDLKDEFASYDAMKVFDIESIKLPTENRCISGDILKGIKKPGDCPLFARGCTPITPYGAPMVSSEGTCSAYYNYKRNMQEELL